ncbi:spliceosomal complex subunit [Schizosaccharomyces osmophilus]|uniref:Spliceosomal complex subunit n=1 Tax=Schizosaccharomyces osmophilus TaxID=2545709 RepID=A0AAE9WH83_9SCHI|nr:spliceosomal complex subunit [Schizosaccharomyces osmophilus]WBW74543.1 spliceosomal complex subunit [Schizosaccharomyces osmophilus]
MNVDSIFQTANESSKKRTFNEPDSTEKSLGKRRTDEPEIQDIEDEAEFDEEGGRFFGSGLSEREKESLHFLDQNEETEQPVTLTTNELKKKVVKLEKSLNQNQELRSKYPESPEKFIESEADLDEEIRSFNIISEYPSLFPLFIKLGCVTTFLELLTHENADIMITVVDLFLELTNEDIDDEALNSLFEASIQTGFLQVLVSGIKRLDEKNEADRHGVYSILSLFENLVSIDNEVCSIVAQKTDLLQWLLQRISVSETYISTNLQYSVEVLAIFLSHSRDARKSVCELNGTDLLLRKISPYRLRDPSQGLEEETMENVFDCLSSLTQETYGKDSFMKEEGIELCILNMKNKGKSRESSFKVIDYLLFGPLSMPYCQHFVQAGGLKHIFSTFMKSQSSETIDHLLAIFCSLFRSLPADTIERMRFYRKFSENDCEKTRKIFSIYRKLNAQIEKVNKQKDSDRTAETEEEKSTRWFLVQIDHGLFAFQSVVVILGWLCVEDNHMLEIIRLLLTEANFSMNDLKEKLFLYYESLEDPAIQNEESDDVYRIEEKPMIAALLEEFPEN